jgi:hypothetical protein
VDPGDRWPSDGLSVLGLAAERHVRVESRFGYQLIQKSATLDDRFPRRVGIPAKRPLF